MTKFTLYEPSPPIGTLRLEELLKNLKDVAANKDVRDFALYQTAAFLYLDRLLKEVQSTKQNHQEFIENFLHHLEKIRYPSVAQFEDLCKEISTFKVTLLPHGKPLLSAESSTGKTVEDLQSIVTQTKKHLEQTVVELKRVAKKVEQRNIWYMLLSTHQHET